MFQLVYTSAAVTPFSQKDIEEILTISREKNAQHNITGVLLYKSGLIVQVLEGDEKSVRQLYRNICRDVRHEHVTLIYSREISVREFPGWSMGFRREEVNFPVLSEQLPAGLLKAEMLDSANGRGGAILKTFLATTR